MRISIIVFSPSGNTLSIAESIHRKFENVGDKVQLLNISGEEIIFRQGGIRQYLDDNIESHDLLLIGSPVYAHHLQYHVINLIKNLPLPNSIWSKDVIPFISYGGISSGLALAEATKLLEKKDRIVIGKLKIVASHRMTKAFMDNEFNSDKNEFENCSTISNMLTAIKTGKSIKNNASQSTNIMSLGDRIKAMILKEKFWQKKIYPNIIIDIYKCTNCRNCVNTCPVNHLIFDGCNIKQSKISDCIHCLNCVSNCSKNAISLIGDLEKGKAFMEKKIKIYGNKELPESEFYYYK